MNLNLTVTGKQANQYNKLVRTEKTVLTLLVM